MVLPSVPDSEAGTPLEKILEREIQPRLADKCKIRTQVPIDTPWGTFNIGILLIVGSRKIGLECDGDKDCRSSGAKAELRDALILAAGSADAIYRFPGGLVWSRPADGLFALSTAEPPLFSAIGRTQLELLCTNTWDSEYEPEDVDGETLEIQKTSSGFRLQYRRDDYPFPREFLLSCNKLLTDSNGPTLLSTLGELARRHPGKTFNELEELSLKGID